MLSKLNRVFRDCTILLIFVTIACSKEPQDQVLNFNDVINDNLVFEKEVDVCMMRIAGGEVVPARYVPYQVSIKQKFKQYYLGFCGGSLVSYRFVLTSAHCFCSADGHIMKPLEQIIVVAGSERSFLDKEHLIYTQSRRVKDFWRHKDYDLDNYKHDIGVVQVEYNFLPGSAIRPIPMMKNSTEINLHPGKLCVISGFGMREYDVISNELRLVCLPFLSDAACEHYYGEPYVRNEFVCAGIKGRDSCTGDSGGPLVCDGVQVGVMTFGSSCGGFPGMYTNVQFYADQLNLVFINGASVLSRDLYFTPVLPLLYKYFL